MVSKRMSEDFLLRDKKHTIHLVGTGLKVLVGSIRPGVSVPYRLHSDGLSFLLPFLGPARVVTASLEDLVAVLSGRNMVLDNTKMSKGMRNKLVALKMVRPASHIINLSFSIQFSSRTDFLARKLPPLYLVALS